MSHIRKHILWIICALTASQTAWSQEGETIVVRDLETWSSAELSFRANDKWLFGIENQLRLDRNSTEVESFFSEFSIERKLNQHFSFTTGIRYINKVDNKGNVQGSEHYLRYFIDGEFEHIIERFELKYRLRYTNRNELGISLAEGEIPMQNFRFKTTIGYNIKNWKLDPKVAGEIFNRYEKDGDKNGFNKVRVSAGTNYKLGKFGKVGLAYRLERQLTSYYPKTTYIILASYSYRIKRESKSDD